MRLIDTKVDGRIGRPGLDNWRPRGLAVVMWSIVCVGLLGCERAKDKLDREVDRLCAIDGGVHIYWVVKLPKEDFGPDGDVFPQYRAGVASGNGLGPGYKWETATKKLVEGDPP